MKTRHLAKKRACYIKKLKWVCRHQCYGCCGVFGNYKIKGKKSLNLDWYN